MRQVFLAFGRAVFSQFHWRMLGLTVVPFLLALIIWGGLLYLSLQPLIDYLHAWFAASGSFSTAGDMLGWIGLGAFSAVMIPLIAMWMLLPLMIVTALIFVGVIAMPTISRHVSKRHYSDLERLRGGSFFGSMWVGLSSFLIFAILWIVTLPLTFIPPLTLIVQPMLLGWLTYRVFSYDALVDHATAIERERIMKTHRWPLLGIGAVAGALGTAPALLWLGGAMVFLFPVLAAGAIWLYVVVFVFSGLWFQHYCLEALRLDRNDHAQLAMIQTEPAPII